MGGAVDVGLEGHPGLVDLAQGGERHDLKAAGIGEDRIRPVHELVQAAESRDALGARAQHEVIGVAQDDVGSERLDLIGIHRLDSGGGADRHEGGGADHAARHADLARPCRTVGPADREGELVGAHG
jgi:hypothetical protein